MELWNHHFVTIIIIDSAKKSMDAETSGWTFKEVCNIYIVSKVFTHKLFINYTKERIVTYSRLI